ncbi:tyrosine-type recombinase/integrase [Dinoroseobacter sp. S124A]|uniref:tyrosine-type recombinase/integrase n=1 Tax=Dinoroseobacter sp. S124A TaxID=3415128 RepID=UPI003C7D6C2D
MRGKDLPRYVTRHKRDGMLYFQKRNWGQRKLETQFSEGAPVPIELHLEIARILDAPRQVRPGKDLAAVVDHYRRTRLPDLGKRTQADYEKHLPYIETKLGHLAPASVQKHHVIAWHGAWAKKGTPHAANYRLRVLSIIMEHARDMGLLRTEQLNPCAKVKQHKYDKQEREPWPLELIAKMREAYSLETRERLIFELLLGTGQRIGDVLKMQWGDLDNGGINVRQNKTGKRLWVPLTRHAQAALDAAEKRHTVIVCYERGPLSYRQASFCLHNARKAIGSLDYDLHSLRYSAAAELVLAGCSDELVASVTGQSAEMVRHYTKSVRQKVRALDAQNRRE